MNQRKTVIALGFFDGIHTGHGALFKKTRECAAEKGAEPAVLTFDNHPDYFVKHERVELISSATDRMYIIRRFFGIENVFFLHFNAVTMRMPWRDFIERIIDIYGAVHFVVGHDFCFGYKGEGTAEILRQYCLENSLSCDIIPPVTREGIVVSSTYIRSLLLDGNMERANAFLGHPYLITDIIRTGFRIGRTIEAPTINMLLGESVLVPKHGVYATKVVIGGAARMAVTNIGMRPTFNGDRVTVETNILDFDGDLYGQSACVEFYSFIRPERRFDSVEDLQAQIRRDADRAREILA
ncbi:MAG: bifunctional riboflavin kinase/FAD synthetase [Butyricicoccus sp.]|nr:bifunctional riboflavin kinase/FAD synthetase [Butyricicoccus sp.]